MDLEIKGLQETMAGLERLGGTKLLERNVRRSSRKAMKPVLEGAKRRVRVDDGDLRDSLAISVRRKKDGNLSARVGPDTRTVVRMDEGKARKKRPKNYAHLVEFGTEHSAPRSFLRSTWDQEAERAVRIFGEEMAKGLERAAKRGGAG